MTRHIWRIMPSLVAVTHAFLGTWAAGQALPVYVRDQHFLFAARNLLLMLLEWGFQTFQVRKDGITF